METRMGLLTPEDYNRIELEAGRLTYKMLTVLVKEYQANHKLSTDGEAGPLTRQSLDPTPVIPTYDVAFWGPYIKAGAAARGHSDSFCSKWVEVESGGNPAEVGNIKSLGPDGNPLEMGIAQFYNPDDLIRLKIKGADLRAYCIPGTQKVSRALTDAECKQQVEGLFGLIDLCKKSAIGDLSAISAMGLWSSRDFYKLVKLQHALPGLSHSGLRAVMRYLGRPPKNWDEFVDNLGHVKLDSATEQYRAEFPKILRNAYLTGEAA